MEIEFESVAAEILVVPQTRNYSEVPVQQQQQQQSLLYSYFLKKSYKIERN